MEICMGEKMKYAQGFDCNTWR